MEVCRLYQEAEEGRRQGLAELKPLAAEARILAELEVIAVTKEKEALPIAASRSHRPRHLPAGRSLTARAWAM